VTIIIIKIFVYIENLFKYLKEIRFILDTLLKYYVYFKTNFFINNIAINATIKSASIKVGVLK
jgi:hypothetical protein